jgi:uncharacterized protein (TIGR03790 family)
MPPGALRSSSRPCGSKRRVNRRAYHRPVASLHVLTICLAFWLATASAAAEDLSSRVLVVVNAKSEASARIGEYYAAKRAIPAGQVLRLSLLDAQPPDGIDRRLFETAIQAPIARWLASHQAQDRILFIVLTKDIPLRIEGGSQPGTTASVDSELALLYLRMTGASLALSGPIPNPYFLANRPIAEARRFAREDQSIYLVTRLDGYTVEDVLAVIDRGAAPSVTGRFVLDAKSSWSDKGNEWLRQAVERLKAAGLPGDRVLFDEGASVVIDQDDVLGYYSWGSNDPAIRRRDFNLRFRPGAIGAMFVSTDGRTFREPPADWPIGNWDDKSTWFAGSPQSLMGDLIRQGISGVAGHVAEPLLGHTIRPNVLFPAYFAGFTLAEAFYLSMPSLSWMTVVVGDPLCAPFATGREQTRPATPIDPLTELPETFAKRRQSVLAKAGTVAAVQHFLRAESRAARGDRSGSVQALEAAVSSDASFALAFYALAAEQERAQGFDRAIATYRRLLAASPNEAVALNNLAYLLAVHKGDLAAALPLAERAGRLAPTSPDVADTLGWIRFLGGDALAAEKLLGPAARVSQRPDIRLHFAEVLIALGKVDEAKKELEAIEKMADDLTRPEELARVKRLLEPGRGR